MVVFWGLLLLPFVCVGFVLFCLVVFVWFFTPDILTESRKIDLHCVVVDFV